MNSIYSTLLFLCAFWCHLIRIQRSSSWPGYQLGQNYQWSAWKYLIPMGTKINDNASKYKYSCQNWKKKKKQICLRWKRCSMGSWSSRAPKWMAMPPNIFVQIGKYICLNWKIYLSKLENIFVFELCKRCSMGSRQYLILEGTKMNSAAPKSISPLSELN